MNGSQEQASPGPEGPAAPGPAAAPGAPYAGAAQPAGWSQSRWASHRKSPVLTGILSAIMPGLGQIYLGYYQRGFVHAGIFAGTIAMLASGPVHGAEPLFGIFLGFFYFYNIIDAVRRASLFNQALAGMDPVRLPEDFKMPAGRPSMLGGLVLAGLGIIFLMHTRFDFDLDWVADWWPAALVIIGGWMVYRSRRDRKV